MWQCCECQQVVDLKGREFDSQSGRYQVLNASTPSRYICQHQDQLSLPSLRGR